MKKVAYHHGDLRSQLVEATRQLVEEKGPSGFSVAEAARQAAVSSAAPYRHFKDRTAMLHAVAEAGMKRLTASFDEKSASLPEGSVEVIATLGCAYVDFAAQEPGVFRLIFAAHEETPESLEEAASECHGRLLRQVAMRIGAPIDSEATRLAARPLWMLVHGAAFLLIDGKLSAEAFSEELYTSLRNATRDLLSTTQDPH
ncbi:MAG: TetR/AcrR family transcriptional regulator [Pseudomonadota bacterium]